MRQRNALYPRAYRLVPAHLWEDLFIFEPSVFAQGCQRGRY